MQARTILLVSRIVLNRAVIAWQHFGAKCVAITRRAARVCSPGPTRMSSAVNWETVCRGSQERIWFAEGKVKPRLLPAVPVKVVVVLHHAKGQNGTMPFIEHHADLYMQTDSKSAAVVTKMLGKSSHKIAETGLGQLQLFFSGLSWYVNRYPEKAEAVLRD